MSAATAPGPTPPTHNATGRNSAHANPVDANSTGANPAGTNLAGPNRTGASATPGAYVTAHSPDYAEPDRNRPRTQPENVVPTTSRTAPGMSSMRPAASASQRREPWAPSVVAVLALAAVVLASTVLLFIGCARPGFPDRVAVAGQSLTREHVTALLAAADTVFTAEATRQRAALTPRSRCYLALTGDHHTVGADELLCGPVRIYGASPDQQWTPLPIHVSDTGNVEPGTPDPIPVTRPETPLLARPDGAMLDGAMPDDGSDLALPPPPADKPATIRFIDAAELGTTPLRPPTGDGLLLGPRTAVKVAGVGAGDTYGRGADARSASPGEQFLFLQLGPTPAFNTVVSADSDPGHLSTRYLPNPTAAIVVGATRHPLPTVNGAPPTGGVWVISAPRTAPTYLEINDQGRPQRFDIRAGTRVSSPEFTPLYRRTNYVTIGRRAAASLTPVDGGSTVRFAMTFTRAVLTSFDPDQGWAPSGFVWLTVAVTDYGTTGDATTIPRFAASAFTIKPMGGRPVPALQQTTVAFPDRLLAPVPPTTSTATLTCHWTGDVVFINAHAAMPSPPQTFTITIPAT